MSKVYCRWLIVAAACSAVLVHAAPARSVPAQTVVFLSSEQKVFDTGPHLSLFGYYYGRTGVSLLGLYAGPRWKFGDLGVEFKGGVYGGADLETRAIVNNQIDFSKKHLSVTWFNDWYPPDEIYSYLNTMLVFGPLYVGGVADLTYDWSAKGYTTFSEGPSIGLGTKSLYFGTAYLFTNHHSQAIRMTVGLTL